MVRRVARPVSGTGIALVLCGGLSLLTHPGFSAPGVPAPGGARAARPAVPSAPRSPIAPKPSGTPTPEVQKPALPAVPPPGDAIMPVSEVRAGMKGYGLTVFRGTKIERFDVEVLGVLPKSNQGEPLVLVRLSGGPISQRGAYLIQGMSGSPIYIDGKLLGAFSMGNAWPKEPIGMVTPIEDMMEALDPKLSEIPAGQTADLPPANAPTTADAAGNSANPLAAPTQTFRPLALPVSISGLTGSRLAKASQLLGRFNLSAMQGPGSMDKPFKADLTPGAAIGVALMTGDIDMTAIGTVTYRKGDQVLAFGHPMMQIGAAQFPITTAWIHDVFPGFQVSSKIGSAGELCGTLTQDRAFSIAGRLGKLPTMVPIHCEIKDTGNGRARTFNVLTANHPLLVGQLVPLAVDQALTTMRPVPGDALAHVHLKVETDGEGTITRDNIFFDPFQIDQMAVRELGELLDTLTSNSFHRVPVKSVDVKITLEDKRPTATVERVFLAQDRFQPGEDAEVGVVLRPYHRDPVVLKTKVHVPENAANGSAVLLVQGGGTRINLGPLLNSQPGQLPTSSQPPDASLRQVLKRWTTRERNDQIVVRLIFRTAAVNVNGERLSQLPSTIVDVMRSSKATGFRIERDEAKALQNTDYVVQGVQTLEINVQKNDHLERSKPTSSRMSPGGATTVSAPGAAGSPLSVGDDQDDLSVPGTRRGDLIPLTIDGKQHFLRLTPEEDEPEPDPKPARKTESAKPEKPAKTEKPSASRGKSGRDAAKSAAGTENAKDNSTEAGSTPAKTVDSKLIGRQAVLWTQTSQADFERGTLSGTAINTSGDVRLAPNLREATESSEQFVWSVLGMGGNIYAGTGNGGQVLKVDGGDHSSVFFRTGELEVHTLARDPEGNLFAGTSPNGKIFRIDSTGKGTELLSMNGTEPASDAGSKFVLSMAMADDGTLYAGTGPNGKIYRIRGTATPEVLCALPAKSVTSLALGENGTLYAGTSENGAIYRINTTNGKLSVLYDSDQSVINGLAVDPSGKLFAALAPSGEIYRIEPDGTARLYCNKMRGTAYGLVADRSGSLYTSAGNSIYRIELDGSATILTDRKAGQFTCLGWDEQGHLLAGSANMGSVYRLSPTISGAFESTVHDAHLPARWGRIRYTGSLPNGGVLTVQTRSGNTMEPDATWSDWQNPETRDTGTFVASPSARFLQYRLLLQAEQGTPSLKDITISYLPRNQAPRLALVSPAGGEIWHGSQTLKWSATDPDSDTLNYEVSYSADGGRTWSPVGAAAREAGTPTVTTNVGPSRESALEALKRYREQLDKDASLTPQQRDQNYEKAKSLIDRYIESAPTGSASSASGGSATPAPAEAAATGSTRQAQITWDTAKLPDGVYLLRVVASDKPSNPTDALTDTKISEPFIVSNTPPQLFVFERGITVDAARNATVIGFVAGKVAIRGAQYRVDDGEWAAFEAEDGIWDSAFEHFRFGLPTLPAGEHRLEVKVVDSAANAATTTVKFKVP